MQKLNNLTTFESFKEAKDTKLVKEDFGGKGNVSGGIDFFEDAKKTLVGGLIDKFSGFIRTKINKQMLRNLAHRYNQELLAGVLKYSQKKNIVISDDMKIMIKKEEEQEFKLSVIISAGETVKKASEKIIVGDTIKYVEDEKDKEKSTKVEDGEYILNIGYKITVASDKITKVEEIKKEEQKVEDDKDGKYIFKFEDKDIEVFIPKKTLETGNEIYGYEDGVSGKTLTDGDYSYTDKNEIITIKDNKIDEIKKSTKKEELITLNGIYLKDFKPVHLILKCKEYKDNSDISLYIKENEELKKIDNTKFINNIFCYVSNEKLKIENIIIILNNKINKILNYSSILSRLKAKYDNIIGIITEVENKKMDIDVAKDELLGDKSEVGLKKSQYDIKTLSILSENMKLEPESKTKIQKVLHDFQEILDKMIKTSLDDFNTLKKILLEKEKELETVHVSDVHFTPPIIGEPKKDDNTQNINASYNYQGSMINEAFVINRFNNAMKNRKLENDLSKGLEDSYKELNLDSLKDMNLNKEEVCKYVNISNIIYIQIRAEQLYISKKDNKVNENMKRYWESLIQNVKKYYEKYLDVNAIDPIKLRNDLEKVRSGDGKIGLLGSESSTPTINNSNSIKIESSALQQVMNSVFEAKEFKGPIKEQIGSILCLNVDIDKKVNNFYTIVCVANTTAEKDGIVNYKILSIVNSIAISNELKKNVKMSEELLKKYSYNYDKNIPEEEDDFYKYIKSLGFKQKNSQNGQFKLKENYIFTISKNTLKDFSYTNLSLYSTEDIKDNWIKDNNIIDTYKDKIKFYDENNRELVNGFKRDTRKISLIDKFYEIKQTSTFNNYFSKLNNKSTSLFYFKNILNNFIKKA